MKLRMYKPPISWRLIALGFGTGMAAYVAVVFLLVSVFYLSIKAAAWLYGPLF